MGQGREGGIALAKKVLETLEHKPSEFRVLYPDEMGLEDKISTVAREIYGAEVTLSYYAFLRGERKFQSLSELTETVLANAEQARALLKDRI